MTAAWKLREDAIFTEYEDLITPWLDVLALVVDGLKDPADQFEAVGDFIEAVRMLRERRGVTDDQATAVELILEPAREEWNRIARECPDVIQTRIVEWDELRNIPPSRWAFFWAGCPTLDGFPTPEETARRIVQAHDERRGLA